MSLTNLTLGIPTKSIGWCGTTSHARDSHERRATCVAFISEDEHAAWRAAAEREQRLANARRAIDAMS